MLFHSLGLATIIHVDVLSLVLHEMHAIRALNADTASNLFTSPNANAKVTNIPNVQMSNAFANLRQFQLPRWLALYNLSLSICSLLIGIPSRCNIMSSFDRPNHWLLAVFVRWGGGAGGTPDSRCSYQNAAEMLFNFFTTNGFYVLKVNY